MTRAIPLYPSRLITMGQLEQIAHLHASSLYRVSTPRRVKTYISTSPETRAICNDPFVLGVEYTAKLRKAMTTLFEQLREAGELTLDEEQAVVVHILRGGLNFGLREALADAYQWNRHSSAFISSQRAQDKAGEWHITENRYEKVFIPAEADLVFGDVVATGVSLEHALLKIVDIAVEQKSSIRSITFVTVGGQRAEEILEAVDAKCREQFEGYEGSRVIYVEGRFAVAEENDQRLQIALGGTDLLRRDSLLTPEFADSQSEGLPFAIERCTIYDAGSRAFHVEEYLEDVRDYWTQVKGLAESGTTLAAYLEERFPEDPRVQDRQWMEEHNSADELKAVADGQLKKAA